ncbi:uncharacterized protein LOC132803352 [Ziziphus jujuba]|uniref:Uncharacterized protein LOC132803352 n=1 Tax=Ziziphus jujuba TaxID=326968 RepID=A0ABM4A5Q6_ZIZJJ|nr:uncharacterized protein LOC132803352 [Ziziphus jujuba]
MADANSSNSKPATGRETKIEEKKENNLEVKAIKILRPDDKQKSYTKEELFRGLNITFATGRELTESEANFISESVNAVFHSPLHWGFPEDVVNQFCERCNRTGTLSCFSPSYRKWLLKYSRELENEVCSKCGVKGHRTQGCPLPLRHKWPKISTPVPASLRPARAAAAAASISRPYGRVVKRRKAPRCSRCGETGHNCRSCRITSM